MAFSVKIRQGEDPVPVEMGQTILEAALAHGVPFPHGCRSGNCGACKSRLFAGEVEMAPYSDYALTATEAADGLVLACRAVPWSDAEIAWLDEGEQALHPQRRLTCRTIAVDRLTHDIARVRLAVESGGPFTFSAGQYAAVGFAGLPPRDYSMANRPDDPVIEFHIRKMGEGSASAYAVDRLAAGEIVSVEGPFGTAFLRERHTGPILAIAGGSGLAPIKSIVETALLAGARQPIALYVGAREERDLYLEDDLLHLAARHANLTVVPVLSEPTAPTRRRTGFVHVAALADADAAHAGHADFDGFKAYLAGPPVMVEAATTMLKARGLPAHDIHADAFYTEAQKQSLATGAAP